MTMSKRSRKKDCRQMELPLMLSAEGSPAKTLAQQDEVQVLQEKEVASGLSSTGSSKKSNRATRSLKTFQPFDLADWTKSSGPLPRSGMMQNGIVYPLPPLVPLTKETGSGLWRTPNAGDSKRGTYASKEAMDAHLARGKQLSLPNQIRHPHLWPTPRACSSMSAKMTPKLAAHPHPNLETVVARTMWPTPTAHNAKEGAFPAEYLRNTPTLAAMAGGRLNPTWVEWLMGFPSGHTDCEFSAMRSSRKSQK